MAVWQKLQLQPGVVEPVLTVQKTGPESGIQEEDVRGVEDILAEDQTAGVHVVEPVLPVQGTGPDSGKQEEDCSWGGSYTRRGSDAGGTCS